MSKQYGVGAKLAGMSDPRAALAGKVLQAIGGAMHHRRRHHKVVHRRVGGARRHHHRR